LKALRRVATKDGIMRIVVAKPGLDGHDRGAKVIARALRDGGHEVIYTGLRRTPAEIVRIVMDEDAAAVGLSTLSGAHAILIPRLCGGLREAGMTDVVVFAGGIIPEEDRPALFEEGVRAIFGPGTTTSEILDFLKTLDERAEAGEAIGVGEDPGWHWE
jgi:methylmalonyl-CoA mutase C-terminal domain/subunit|tara:strand:- start:1770 stop:2246 length:477 start_codon:yes stop_codon:yes gene_type:complete